MLSNTNVKISDVKLTSNAPFFANRAVSGKYQRRYTGVQYYSLDFTANYMSSDTSVVQKFVAQYMYGRPFLFNISYAGQYTGSARGSIISNQTVLPGTRQITIGGFSGTLEAGTIIQFENHKKLYTVTEDVQSGKALKIFPALIKNVQNGEAIKYQNPQGEFVLTNDSIPYDLKSISKIQFKATENI
ncbi:hypothetical protein ACLH2J_01975 [Klebsiella michiganensis]|uniref:hypothetical protein n=1 Tax=Klebsiella michiganensis TaxID=1134687 RepID=UPI00398349DC